MRFVDGEVWMEFEEDESGEKLAQIAVQSPKSQISEWIAHQKAKGNAEDSDPLTLKILVEIYQRIEELTNLVKNPQVATEIAGNRALITNVGYEGFTLQNGCLIAGKKYFARVKLPVFMGAEILMRFISEDAKTARIEKISSENEWSSWVASCERAMIRRQKMNLDKGPNDEL